MKYFCSKEKRTGSCYVEFCGVNNSELWDDSSIFIDDELMGEIGLTKVITEVIPTFDPYGVTITVDRAQWLKIKASAEDETPCWEALKEIEAWAEDNLRKYQGFKILGI